VRSASSTRPITKESPGLQIARVRGVRSGSAVRFSARSRRFQSRFPWASPIRARPERNLSFGDDTSARRATALLRARKLAPHSEKHFCLARSRRSCAIEMPRSGERRAFVAERNPLQGARGSFTRHARAAGDSGRVHAGGGVFFSFRGVEKGRTGTGRTKGAHCRPTPEPRRGDAVGEPNPLRHALGEEMITFG